MGGAVFAALDGETNFATVPERVEAALRGAVGSIGERIAKPRARPTACRRPARPPRTRQVIRDLDHQRGAGNREVVRVRPFVRVASNLSLSTLGALRQHSAVQSAKHAAPMPTQPAVAADDAAGAEPDAEVSFVTRDLATVLPRAKIAAVVPIDDVLARVREAANWTGSAPSPAAGARLPARHPARLRRRTARARPLRAASRRASCRRTSRCCRRPPTQATGGNAWNERTVARQEGRHGRLDPARARRHRRTRSRRSPTALGARGTRRRPAGRPQAAHPARAGDRRQAAAAGARHHRQRHQHRGDGRAVRHRQIRRGRRAQRQHRGRRAPATTRRTTARACGSTRASTRPRCATRCRAR